MLEANMEAEATIPLTVCMSDTVDRGLVRLRSAVEARDLPRILESKRALSDSIINHMGETGLKTSQDLAKLGMIRNSGIFNSEEMRAIDDGIARKVSEREESARVLGLARGDVKSAAGRSM